MNGTRAATFGMDVANSINMRNFWLHLTFVMFDLCLTLTQLQEQEESLHEKTEQVSTQRQRLEQLERSDMEQKTSLVELRDVIAQLEAELEAQTITNNVRKLMVKSYPGSRFKIGTGVTV